MINLPDRKRSNIRRALAIGIVAVAAFVAGIAILVGDRFDVSLNHLVQPGVWSDFFAQDASSVAEPKNDAAVDETKRNRFSQLAADMQLAFDSAQLQELKDTGRPGLERLIQTSLSAANRAFEAGDVDNALRILESAKGEWINAATQLVDLEIQDQFKTEGVENAQQQTAADQLTANIVPTLSSFQAADDVPVVVEQLPQIAETPALPEAEIQQPVAEPVRASSPELPESPPGLAPSASQEQAAKNASRATVQQIAKIDASQSASNSVSRRVQAASSTPEPVLKEEERQTLIRQFDSYIAEIDRALNALVIQAYDVPDMSKIVNRAMAHRNKSVEAREAGDIQSASRFAKSAMREIESAQQYESEQFELSLDVATKAYAAGSAEQAREAIERAASLRPNDSKVIELQVRINDLPALLQAQKDAETARNAGKYEQEIEALNRILAIEPNNSSVAARIQTVRQVQSDGQFAMLVGQAHLALDEGDLAAAKHAVANVSQLRSSDPDTKALKTRLGSLEKNLKLRQYLAAARRSSQQDDWPGAIDNYQLALGIEPDNAEAGTGQEFAKRMVDAQAQIERYLQRPERLSAANMARAAKKVVSESQLLGTFSSSLQVAAAKLDAAISEWQMPVAVKIVSDGSTDIGIRNVGRIGIATERLIELKPGKYVFEGKRKGYKSVLIEVVIELGATSVQEVSVICSEKI